MVEATLMGEDAQEDGQYRFNDLGGILLPRPIYFQGPDIDPYLPWVCEVDVATMIAMLSHEIEFGSAEVPLPSQTASAVEERQLEKELFDVEGNSVCFGGMCVVDCVTVVLFVGFQKELKAYGTGDLGRVVEAMNAKALVAGRVLLRREKAESDKMLEGSAERLKLVAENDRLKTIFTRNRMRSWRRRLDVRISLLPRHKKSWTRGMIPLRVCGRKSSRELTVLRKLKVLPFNFLPNAQKSIS
jgi:hypothetical protein